MKFLPFKVDHFVVPGPGSGSTDPVESQMEDGGGGGGYKIISPYPLHLVYPIS